MLWILAAVWADDVCDGVCLLALKADPPALAAPAGHGALAASFAAWGVQHRSLRAHVLNSEEDFKNFIADQQGSSDACHAQLLEARRTADGLHRKVSAISEAIRAAESIVAAHTAIIDEKNEEKHRAEEAHNIALAACDDAKATEWQAKVDSLDKELAELISFANVKSQYDPNKNPGWKDAQLLQQNAWTAEQCHKTRALIQQHKQDNSTGESPVYFELDCNATYDKLQHEYGNSVTQLRELRYSAVQLVTDNYESCTTLSSNNFEEIKERVNDAVDASTAKIEKALDRVAAMDPTLSDAKRSLLSVSSHVKDLQDKCKVDDGATVHLMHIRDLIENLEHCPGRHNFGLQKPSV